MLCRVIAERAAAVATSHTGIAVSSDPSRTRIHSPALPITRL